MENFDEYDIFEEYANILHDLSMEVDELTSVEELEEIISEMENVLMEAESDEDLSEEDLEELISLADGLISELYDDLLNLKKSNMKESKKVIRLTESDLVRLVKKVIKEQNNQDSGSPYQVGQVYSATRSIDNKLYTITISKVGNGWVFANVKGPGTWEGNDLTKGFGMELNASKAGKLGGNMDLGEFINLKKIK